MKKLQLSSIAFALSALTFGQAFAAHAPLTREQVRMELAEAQRTGDIVVDSETGLKANELNPGMYPAKPMGMSKTRDQVRMELAEAKRTGDIVVDSETGMKANELNPSMYPAQAKGMGKTRAQVKAELADAVAKGEVQFVTN